MTVDCLRNYLDKGAERDYCLSMPADTKPTATAETTFTACALVRIRIETIKPMRWDADTATHIACEEYACTTETGRVEFIPMGAWVLVRGTQDSYSGCWEAHTRDEARALYKSIASGRSRYYLGAWTLAEATTKIVGSKDMPARRETYSYGETAYMYTEVDFPAMTCPIIETTYRGKTERQAAQPFKFTTPPTPGDRYRHDRTAIQWTNVA